MEGLQHLSDPWHRRINKRHKPDQHQVLLVAGRIGGLPRHIAAGHGEDAVSRGTEGFVGRLAAAMGHGIQGHPCAVHLIGIAERQDSLGGALGDQARRAAGLVTADGSRD